MNIVPASEVLLKKWKRQKSIKELEFHCANNYIHVGKISYGCKSCLLMSSHLEHQKLVFGTRCNLNCPMCYKRINIDMLEDENRTRSELINTYQNSLNKDFKPLSVSYVSDGETLFYLDDIEKHSDIIKKIEIREKYKSYKHIYTNGTLINDEILNRLKRIGITEIRFHLTSVLYSDKKIFFIDKILEKMFKAKQMGFIITIEEPAWPAHKDLLMSLLPMLENIGLDHMNLTEVDVTTGNKDKLNKICPNAIIYKVTSWLMYDEGMTYDIMEEVIDKNYSFSVFECSSRIIPARVEIFHEEIDGLVREFDHSLPEKK